MVLKYVTQSSRKRKMTPGVGNCKMASQTWVNRSGKNSNTGPLNGVAIYGVVITGTMFYLIILKHP